MVKLCRALEMPSPHPGLYTSVGKRVSTDGGRTGRTGKAEWTWIIVLSGWVMCDGHWAGRSSIWWNLTGSMSGSMSERGKMRVPR